MNLRENLMSIYNALRNDEKLLRLLHYVPKNQLDDPLDSSKPNILDMDIEEQYEIIEQVLIPTDKKFELDMKSYFSRICLYMGERKPVDQYSAGARQLLRNTYASEQTIVIDVYTNIEIDAIDMRMTWICDTINEILFEKDINQFSTIKPDVCYPIMKTPDQFIGYRMTYYMTTAQEPKGGRR